MAVFPKIQGSCPYQDNLSAIMEGDRCRLCKRNVFDLTDMDDAGRRAFMAGCSGDVCVSYRIRPAIAAAALAAAVSALPAAATPQEHDVPVVLAGMIPLPQDAEFVDETELNGDRTTTGEEEDDTGPSKPKSGDADPR